MENPEFIKYESIAHIDQVADLSGFLSSRDVSVFEKLDGGNCQISNINYNLFPANRSNFLQGPIIRRRKWFNDFVKWCYSNYSLFNLTPDLIVFGEWTAEHTIEYNPQSANKFFMIDLFDKKHGTFFDYRKAVEVMQSLNVSGVNFLNILAEGNVSSEDIRKLLIDEPSNYYPGPKEGLVIKDYGRQKFIKILHPDFEEKRVEKLGESRKNKDSKRKLEKLLEKYGEDTIDLYNGELAKDRIYDYLTPARCMKAGFRLLDEGKGKINYTDLAREITRDIEKERGIYLDESVVKGIIDRYCKSGKLSKISSYLKK